MKYFFFILMTLFYSQEAVAKLPFMEKFVEVPLCRAHTQECKSKRKADKKAQRDHSARARNAAIASQHEVWEEDKEIKALVLIIASDNFPGINRPFPYKELQEIWRSYMHSDPIHFEVYFIRAYPYLPYDYKIKDNVLWTRTEESVIPGILNKTLLSIESMLPRIQEFDFILRTNLSSFYVFPRLLEFLKTLPKTGCYCGFPGALGNGGKFASGAGFILSTDLAEILIANKSVLAKNNYDDVNIGLFFKKLGIGVIPAPRVDFHSLHDWNRSKYQISPYDFHFRVKNSTHELRATEDVYILSELVKMFYGN